MTLYLCYSLTGIQNPTFGYIKWTPDVALTGSFLDVVFGQYLRQEMGQKMPPKMLNESVIAFFDQKYCPWCHVRFVKNKRIECEIKVPLGYYSIFY